MNKTRKLTMTYTISKLMAATAAVLLAAGCASAPSQTEADFGKSVRSTILNQTYDVGASLYPEKEALTGGNADRLEMVIDAHAGAVSDSQRVQRPISGGVGGQ
jgi:uncharacterized cupredoxin-like copper-binding protein